MVDRTLYVTTFRATYAIDAATCELRWRNVTHVGPALNFANRGPAYLDGMIFRAKGDGRVIGLDAKTGRVVWDARFADPTQLESFVAAPIAWDGKVFIGIAQGDLGIRGRMLALDARTGKELWRFHTVPERGDTTWGPAKPAGGGFWATFSLDPVTGEVFGPVGNPAPDFDKDARPGDNFYTNSVIVLKAATRQLNWHHQQTPRDEHDWDVGAAPTLYRSKSGRALMAVAGKDGHVVGVDRATRQTVFRTAATTIANTGPLTDTLTLVCPGLGGWRAIHRSGLPPALGALFVGSVDWCSYYVKPKPGQSELETAFPDFAVQPRGWVTAIDGETGRVLWRRPMDAQVLAGVVATKSGLVFAGDVRGNLFALDGRSGTALRHIPVGSALNGGLISYAVDGTQYVAPPSEGSR
jgi:glucose dehydrogenase